MNGNGNTSISGELKKGLRTLTVATVVLYLALAGLGIIGYLDGVHRRAEITKVTLETHIALCTFVDDLRRRVATSEQFLLENPDGFPGLSDDVIRESIAGQRQTLQALKALNCDA